MRSAMLNYRAWMFRGCIGKNILDNVKVTYAKITIRYTRLPKSRHNNSTDLKPKYIHTHYPVIKTAATRDYKLTIHVFVTFHSSGNIILRPINLEHENKILRSLVVKLDSVPISYSAGKRLATYFKEQYHSHNHT